MKENCFMKTGIMEGPISNKKIMELSPVDKIAKMIDFYFPYLIKNLLDMVKHKEHHDLIDDFWAITKSGDIDDLIFFYDYRLYINFFLQYPLVTGLPMDENLNCSRILEAYEKIELSGNVAKITEEDEYYYVSNNYLPEEIEKLDETIAEYKAESKLYQANKISEENGKVTLELVDGTIKEGISWGISGVYTGNGYEIKEMLILADLDESDFFQLEEKEIKKVFDVEREDGMDCRENATRAEMKEEAIRRMEALKLDETFIMNFKEDERLIIMEGWIEGMRCFGVAEDELVEQIKAIEAEHDILVYHVIYNDWPMYGPVRTLLYVRKEKDWWQNDREWLLEKGENYAYVLSEQKGDFSWISLQVIKGVAFRKDGRVF